jgi:uncharacterized protein YbjT (DUF2867 family)
MDIVTGAFGYIGSYIARALLSRGREVRTITTHFQRQHSLTQTIQAFPYSFDDPQQLMSVLKGGDTLYNTYWIRFPWRGMTYDRAIRNTKVLFDCAKAAGIRRIVHISVSNAALESSLPYYQGKAQQEELLKQNGIPYTIIRPTLVFGVGDILVNNIAWLLRRFPIFPLFEGGSCRLQPVFVEDLARMAVESAEQTEGVSFDAAGVEVLTFRELVQAMADALCVNSHLISIPAALGIYLGRLIGLATGDIILTRNELSGLMAERLVSKEDPRGTCVFSKWLHENKDQLGQHYASELRRHYS